MKTDLSPNQLATAVRLAADWLTHTQVQDPLSADHGRVLYTYDLRNGQFTRSTGWQTAFAVFALHSAHRVTSDPRHLDAANRAIDYIKSLQILDSRHPHLHGALREETPQTEWMHPRDGLSSAWALLAHFRLTQDHDSLTRAVLYADWMLQHAFLDDWIVATIQLGPRGLPTDRTFGSFQSGSILFLLELFETTQNLRYQAAAQRMADVYVRDFINPAGEITVILQRADTPASPWPQDWQNMHRVNDDFGGISLVQAYRLFQRPDYLQRCSAYFQWLENHANPDGSYLQPVIEVGSATSALFLQSYQLIAPAQEHPAIKTLIEKNLTYLLSIQQHSPNPTINGAFLGMDDRCQVGHGHFINIRCSAYALLAFCRTLEQSCFPLSLMPGKVPAKKNSEDFKQGG